MFGLLLVLLAFLSSAPGVLGFYSKSGDVIALTDMNTVLKDPGVWLVEFYAPWCGHCVAAKPELEKAATALKGIAKVGAVDMTTHQALGSPYGVKGFPTFKIFSNGGKVADFNGQRTASAFVEGVTSALSSLAKTRLNGSGGGSSSQKKSSSSSSSNSNNNNKDVIEKLTDANFDSVVYSSHDMFVVAFVADYCGHCKALKPSFLAAAKRLFGSGIRFATVEGPENSQLSSKFQIQGFPTIKVFGPGTKKKESTYEGPRDEEAIVNFAQETFEKLGGSIQVNVVEITSVKTFEDACGKERKCVLVVLPDLLDASVEQRKRDLQVLTDAAKKARHMPFAWVAANAQPKLEAAFELTFGFPAVLMLREGPQGEKVGFVHRGKFTVEELNKFVNAQRSLHSGLLVKAWPQLEETKAWDGKSEAVKPQSDKEDDFNLDDFLSEL